MHDMVSPLKGPVQLQADLKAIVFDLDGTLYTSSTLGSEIEACAGRHIAALKGIEVKEAERLIRDTRKRISAVSGVDTSLSHACMELGANLEELHVRFAAEIDPRPHITRDERAPALLKALSGRFDIYLYTNNNRRLSARIMKLIGVSGLFKEIFTIEDTWRPKPDRSTLEFIFRAIGSEPSGCMFVGDRYDIDLRLPAEMGSAVYLAKSMEDLLSLAKIMYEENL